MQHLVRLHALQLLPRYTSTACTLPWTLTSVTGLPNTAKSKYRCPGCAARTCSLPCYKRHQQWAQCTGKRDPTRYVKKSQLATPAGVDHDFNFLTSVERGLEKAERDIDSRLPNPVTEFRKNAVADGRFAAAGVHVIRAPKGLSRQRENKTHRSARRNNIIWTVEWLLEDKSRILSQTSEVSQVEEAYLSVAGLPSQKSSKKRKRATGEAIPVDQELQNKAASQEVSASIVAGAKAGINLDDEQPEPVSPGRELLSSDEKSELPKCSEPHGKLANAASLGCSSDQSNPKPISTEYQFFLSKPRTSSDRHVLIPVSPTCTLNECLRGCTVLEFPTLYVFSSSSTPPPADFILEEEYIIQERNDDRELDEFLKAHPNAMCPTKYEQTAKTTGMEVDNSKIFDVLKQDLGEGPAA